MQELRKPLKQRGKKGQVSLSETPGLVITLVVIALVIAVGSIVLNDFRDTQTSGSFAYNASSDGLTAMDNVSNQLGTVGTIIIAAILLGLIVTAFVFFRDR